MMAARPEPAASAILRDRDMETVYTDDALEIAPPAGYVGLVANAPATVSSEVSVLRSIEFVVKGRRYSGRVGPVPDGPSEFDDGAWFVSMDDGPERRVFEAHADDEDTPEFRHRMVIATWLTEGYNRRVSADRRRAAETSSAASERRRGADRRGAAATG